MGANLALGKKTFVRKTFVTQDTFEDIPYQGGWGCDGQNSSKRTGCLLKLKAQPYHMASKYLYEEAGKEGNSL